MTLLKKSLNKETLEIRPETIALILTEMIAVKGVTLVFYLQDKYLFKAYFKAGSGETRSLSPWSSQYSEGDKTKTHKDVAGME